MHQKSFITLWVITTHSAEVIAVF